MISLPTTLGKNFVWTPTDESLQALNINDVRWLVIYFYPKDNTPGCTLEGHDFTRLKKDFEKSHASIFGVSRDSLKSHEGFCQKEGYSIALIADTEGALCKAFDVLKMKKNYGREYEGIERSTFIVDRLGKIVHEWRGVKVDGHAQAVLQAVKNLNK